MEDVLEIYQRPYDPLRPVVCIDETNKQLIKETRIPCEPGQPEKVDSVYVRNGVADIFMISEPLAGRRETVVTQTRTALDFAEILRYTSDTLYPRTEKIVLVTDNLNTHSPASLYKAFPPEEARRLAERFEWHYTPKHGSWLDMAEIEIGIMSRQALGKPLPDLESFKQQVRTWTIRRNAECAKINWQFKTQDARIKLREIMRNLPSEKIVYFGDTARVPYGSKSKETIIRYSRQIIRFLQQQQVKAIVVACNTASAFALDAVRDEFDIPIIGVIEPGAKVAAAQTRNKRVGIIGTVGTVGSGIHAEYLKHLDPEITVFGKACPLFVPLVEEGWLHDPVTDEVAARYLKELQDKQVDTLILGCTHYPLLRSTIRKIMGDGVCLVNPAYETALELGRLLEEKGLAGEGTEKNEFPYRFYVSDLADEFKAFANSILPYDVEMTKKIDIEKY